MKSIESRMWNDTDGYGKMMYRYVKWIIDVIGYDRHVRACQGMSRFQSWVLQSQEQDGLTLANIHVPWNLRGCLLWNVSSALCIAPQAQAFTSWGRYLDILGYLRDMVG